MLKKLMLAATGTALMLGALAVPAAANSTATVFNLNGMAGVKVDMCNAGQEHISWLKYGRVAKLNAVPAGTHTIKIKKAASGKCKGRKLAKAQITFEAGKNYTLVFWKPFKKVLIRVFENDLTLPSADAATRSVRHTASKPTKINVWLWVHVKPAADAFPPTIRNLRRGKSSAPIVHRAGQVLVDVFPAVRTKKFIWEGYWANAPAGTASQLYLIGNATKNFDLVGIRQAGVFTP